MELLANTRFPDFDIRLPFCPRSLGPALSTPDRQRASRRRHPADKLALEDLGTIDRADAQGQLHQRSKPADHAPPMFLEGACRRSPCAIMIPWRT